MKKTFKRLGVFLLACLMCVSTSVVAFAAEVEPTAEATSASESARAALITSAVSADFTQSVEIPVHLYSANWGANFVVTVNNNGSANYYVSIRKPDGTTTQRNIVGGNGGTTEFVLTYAPAGQYTVIVTKNSGTANLAYAVVNVYD